jgi:PhnB protein
MTQKTIIQPQIFFEGRCEEAIEFYKRALGAEVQMLMRFKDNPEKGKGGCSPPPGSDEKIMHAQVRIGESVIMMADARCSGQPKFEGFSLSVTMPTVDEVVKTFAKLSEGGQVQMPLDKTFFTEMFGMVVDKFGVFWMVLVTPKRCE